MGLPFGGDDATLVPPEALQQIQKLFHELIEHRCGELPAFPEWRQTGMPDLKAHLDEHWDPVTRKPKLEQAEHQYVPVPGMYGGFRFEFQQVGPDPVLVSESWCRVAGGSGQRHRITIQGTELVEEGFV
ncbi:hypothetical protein HXX76_011379 [Chlamydomonas incerta]|uniref:Uncharacterized protein n=1 Tax=Chlamydomonas incerta TaxID=51695 RepID=A0A835SUT7_CHLIN|nr:hypothetical protein HXX76_011379 [Chlamydomonas incerta]|eukprot:KAG2428674.1 hypothetical protein HXX76_011379 [Chlamydomonas incerta]